MVRQAVFPHLLAHRAPRIVLLAVLAGGCTSREDQARNAFSEAVVCPASRIEVRELEGVAPSDVRERYHPKPTRLPPPEIAVDPERLAIWQQQEVQQRHTRQESGFFGSNVFEATGCGEKIIYECWRKRKSANFGPMVDCHALHRDR